MICPNCKAVIDNDLVFCVQCGMRLTGNFTQPQLQTPTQPTVAFSNQPKRKFPWLWVSLGSLFFVGLIASSGVLYFLLKKNAEAQKTSVPIEAKNTPYNPATVSNINQNTTLPDREQTAANANSPKDENIIVDETITVEKKDHKAFPFQIKNDSTMLRGQAELIEGEKFKAYVLLEDAYDKFMADSTYAVNEFDGKRGEIVKVNEFTTADKFVLVIENKEDKPIVLKINMFLKKTD